MLFQYEVPPFVMFGGILDNPNNACCSQTLGVFVGAESSLL